MIKIFNFTDPAEYLRECLAFKQKKNENFSLRAWAKQMGMKSHGPLHAMLKGERSIPKKYLPLINKSLGLKSREARYLEAMIDLQRAKTVEEKNLYFEKMKQLAPGDLREVVELASYKYLANPLHFFILEMTELKHFKNNLLWIKNHLRENYSIGQIQDALDRLLELGLLKVEQGNLVKTHRHVSSSKDVVNLGVQEYHRNMSLLAINQLIEQDVSEREFNSFSFNIQESQIIEIKEELRKFCDHLIKEYESPTKEGEVVYHLNLHLFGISKK